MREKKKRLTCMEKGDLEEFWKHLAGQVSCTRAPSSDWSNPRSHPGNDDMLVLNSSHFSTRNCKYTCETQLLFFFLDS